ncbi:TPA: cupin domain-containing protein [Enterobacter ludwigii]
MFIFHNETMLDDLGNGVTRRILAHGGKMMAVEVNFEQGATGPLHNHPHEQLTYVLSGEFEFTIGDEKHVVTAGDRSDDHGRPHLRDEARPHHAG